MTEESEKTVDSSSSEEKNSKETNLTETYRKLDETETIDPIHESNNVAKTKSEEKDLKREELENGKNKNEYNVPEESGNTFSNYVQNIVNSNNALNDKPDKEATLLADSKTIVRFSPIWRQDIQVMPLDVVTEALPLQTSPPKTITYSLLETSSDKLNDNTLTSASKVIQDNLYTPSTSNKTHSVDVDKDIQNSLAALAPIFLTFTSGLTSGYSGILLPQLQEPGSPIYIDESTKSWIASMAALPMAPGCLISGWLMEKFGRKSSQYIICAPFFLGWVLITFANNLGLMLLGRFCTGLCVGLLGPLAPVYIGETSDPKYRGFFLAGVSLAIAVGILVAHLIGTFLSWQITAGICCIFPVLTVVLLSFIPESPTWLISQGQIEKGAKSFTWLRGASPEANAELKGLIDKKKILDAEPEMSTKEKLLSLKSPELLKPLGIMILFFIICQFSGVNAVAFYSIEIVEKAVGQGLDHYMVMLVIDALRTVVSVAACVMCKQYGRRPLCFISGTFTALAMVGLSMFLYWKPPNMAWVPLIFLMIYICAISIGLVPLPWIMCGEVFPTRVRGLGSGISSATTFLAFFIVVKTAPGMMSNFGEVITFLIYGVISLIGTGILYFILPETKGKSLQEIEDKFKRQKNKSEP